MLYEVITCVKLVGLQMYKFDLWLLYPLVAYCTSLEFITKPQPFRHNGLNQWQQKPQVLKYPPPGIVPAESFELWEDGLWVGTSQVTVFREANTGK